MIVLFSIKLLSSKSFKNTEMHYFWLTVLSCFFLVLADLSETICSEDPSLRWFRTLFSVACYVLRATSALGLLLVVMPKSKLKNLLWVPTIIDLLICSTAFFSNIAFGYDKDYSFNRGPLGYIVFIVPLFYLSYIIVIVLTQFSTKKGVEKYIVPLGCVFCFCAALSDVFGGGVHLTESIAINSVFFYIALYSNDSRRDPLTDLLNRQAFYDDCKAYARNIVAVASLDMNGLKTLNDTRGHHAGDQALVAISKCISGAVGGDAQAYRIGGDEFVLLFFRGSPADVANIKERIVDAVKKTGYSISVGYAMTDKNRTLDDVIRASDSRMYEDKAEFYRKSGIDRRRR